RASGVEARLRRQNDGERQAEDSDRHHDLEQGEGARTAAIGSSPRPIAIGQGSEHPAQVCSAQNERSSRSWKVPSSRSGSIDCAPATVRTRPVSPETRTVIPASLSSSLVPARVSWIEARSVWPPGQK